MAAAMATAAADDSDDSGASHDAGSEEPASSLMAQPSRRGRGGYRRIPQPGRRPGRPRKIARVESELEAAEDHTKYVQVSGYVGDLLQTLRCAVCLEVLERAVAAPCMHRFCQECVEKWLRVGRHDCPECKLHVQTRRAFKRDTRMDVLIQSLIAEGQLDEHAALDHPEGVSVRAPDLEPQLTQLNAKKRRRRHTSRLRDASGHYLPQEDVAAAQPAAASGGGPPVPRTPTPPAVFEGCEEEEEERHVPEPSQDADGLSAKISGDGPARECASEVGSVDDGEVMLMAVQDTSEDPPDGMAGTAEDGNTMQKVVDTASIPPGEDEKLPGAAQTSAQVDEQAPPEDVAAAVAARIMAAALADADRGVDHMQTEADEFGTGHAATVANGTSDQ